MNIHQLNEAYQDYFKLGCEHQRFGQYVFNQYNYEAGNSYNEANAEIAYKILFNSLTQTSDEVLGE